VSTRASRAPAQLGAYRLIEPIGRGGMAEVWRAVLGSNAGVERTLAVKRIRPHLAADARFVQMFLAEARLTAQLHHPNIVQIFELGHDAGEYFLAMELVEGYDLARVTRFLRKRGAMPLGFAADVALQLCRALAYAHQRTDGDGRRLGLIHRDVSPSNVMLALDGGVKLLDFGVAKAVTEGSGEQTRTGMLKGKLGYLSPEQVQAQPLDHRSDQFALGVVLHELLTGRPLFRGDSDAQRLAMVLGAEIAPPSASDARIAPELDRICLRALRRDRAERFVDCDEMARALEPLAAELAWGPSRTSELLRELRQSGADAPTAMPVTERLAPRARPRWQRALAVAALGAALLGGAGVWWRHRRPPRAHALPAPAVATPAASPPPPAAPAPVARPPLREPPAATAPAHASSPAAPVRRANAHRSIRPPRQSDVADPFGS
jgi:serine/threonine-protein kinase